MSDKFKIASGVPPSGHLSPLLFLNFINDIFPIFKFSKLLLFADDLKLFHTITSSIDILRLQSDLNNLCHWCSIYGLNLNNSQCMFISISRLKEKISSNYKISDYNLNKIVRVRDLGVTLSKDLSFAEPIKQICSKCICNLGFIKKNCSKFNNHNCLIVIYLSPVRPILEFGSVVWNSN